MDKKKLPRAMVRLDELVFPAHHIDEEHLADPEIKRTIDKEPIFVEQLIDDHWFIHDGRHRALRAMARGEEEIEAYVLTH